LESATGAVSRAKYRRTPESLQADRIAQEAETTKTPCRDEVELRPVLSVREGVKRAATCTTSYQDL